jgi:hypothetical protein
MSYSIFNQAGENIEGELFETAVEAQAFMDATDYVTEYGPVHVGVNCEEHDELEAGTCPHCKRNSYRAALAQLEVGRAAAKTADGCFDCSIWEPYVESFCLTMQELGVEGYA